MNTKIPQGVSLSQFDDYRWVVNTPDGKNVLMNNRAAEFLIILRDSINQDEAIKKFQEHFSQTVTETEFEGLVKTTFKGLNILPDEKNVGYKKSYLTLKVPLLNARLSGFLAAPLSFLFRPLLFWPLFIGMFALNSVATIISFQTRILSIGNSNIILLTVLFGISMLIHELGHIAACRQFRVRHGAIGFGFYFIFPVVYADITQIWNAAKAERIIANAGGIHSELIYATSLLLTYKIVGDTTFLLAATGVFIKAVTELNPFIRYDGYWLLSDITNTPNLMKKSNEALRNVVSMIKLKVKLNRSERLNWNMSVRSSLLFLYSLINTLLLAAYLVYILVNFHSEIIQFPILIMSLFQKTVSFKLSLNDFPNGFLWILGFYILCLKFAISYVYSRLKKLLSA